MWITPPTLWTEGRHCCRCDCCNPLASSARLLCRRTSPGTRGNSQRPLGRARGPQSPDGTNEGQSEGGKMHAAASEPIHRQAEIIPASRAKNAEPRNKVPTTYAAAVRLPWKRSHHPSGCVKRSCGATRTPANNAAVDLLKFPSASRRRRRYDGNLPLASASGSPEPRRHRHGRPTSASATAYRTSEAARGSLGAGVVRTCRPHHACFGAEARGPEKDSVMCAGLPEYTLQEQESHVRIHAGVSK